MSRILFERAGSGYRTVRGQLIKNIQQKLKEAGFNPGVIDGIYGNDTETALLKWQKENNLNTTGKIDDDTWKLLVMPSIPSIYERSLQVTADFEGHSFTKVAGNFDGAGITWGIIGFTLKHGEITKMIQEINQNYPSLLDTSFGSLKSELLSIIQDTPDKQLSWSNKISVGNQKYEVRSDWASAFEKLGNFPQVQAIQINYAQKYWERAKAKAEIYNLKTEMGIALCFDIEVQNGGIHPEKHGTLIKQKTQELRSMSEKDLRVIIANVVAEKSNPRWVEDVRLRKLTFAKGEGTVHGYKYAIKTWGIDEYQF
ncbi:MAG: peptidoglycan-binding protein [Nostoc sp. TH1S01]|nr:peptidoglycan-binding protein [Nostoc sp. TH1S01]